MVLSQANGRSPPPLGEAQERRGRFLRELPAGGVRRSVPVLADGLLLAQAAELRENRRPSGQRRSGLAQGELVPPLRPAGPHGRPLRASVLEGPLKRSEAPRNPGHPKLVGAQRSTARGRTITGKAEGKIGRQLSAVSRTDQTAHLFSAAQILDLRAALRKSVVAV